MAQVQLDPDRRRCAGRRLHLRERLCLLATRSACRAASARSPIIHEATTGWCAGVGRVEQTLGGRVGVVVSACSERAEHSSELRHGDGDLAAGGQAKPLGSGDATLGRIRVTAHAGDHRDDGLASRDPERLAELGRQSTCLLSGGDCDVPLARVRGDDSLQESMRGRWPEASLVRAAVGGGARNGQPTSKAPTTSAAGPEMAHGLRVERPPWPRRPRRRRQGTRRRGRTDRRTRRWRARAVRDRSASPSRRAASTRMRRAVRPGVCPPGPRDASHSRPTCRSRSPAVSRPLGCVDDPGDARHVVRARRRIDHLVDPGRARPLDRPARASRPRAAAARRARAARARPRARPPTSRRRRSLRGIAELGRPSQRGDGDVHGSAAAGAPTRLLELQGDVLVLSGDQCRAVPDPSVGLGLQRLCERLVHTPSLLHAGALAYR